jgi:hypothetical protein
MPAPVGLRPGAITTFPQGLLSLLGIKNDGKYPQSLADSYVPTFDMLNWMALANARELVQDQPTAFSTTGVKAGATGTLLVPAGQVWLACGINYQVSVTATDMLAGAVCLIRGFGAQSQQFNQAPLLRSSPTDAAQASSFQSVLTGPLLLFPGDSVAFYAHDLTTAGTLQGFLSAIIFRFVG